MHRKIIVLLFKLLIISKGTITGFDIRITVGQGKLLVCMSDLKKYKINRKADSCTVQFLKYMLSDKFNPAQTLNPAELVALFKTKIQVQKLEVQRYSYK